MSTENRQDLEPGADSNAGAASQQREARVDAAIAAYLEELQRGAAPDSQDWLDEHADLEPELREFLADRERIELIAQPVREAVTGGPEPGAQLRYVGNYELLEELGRGGMGVVYKARQASLNRLVALKMILTGEHASSDDLARFRAEAETVARIQHPHIVQIHEVGEEEGRPYAALELVEGGSLDLRLDGTPLPAGQAAQLVELLARAVGAGHQRDVVHRDLKPANVLLARSDRPDAVELGPRRDYGGDFNMGTFEPKITDFGLAKLVDRDSGQTRTGAVVGTPSYMAPEQAAGKSKQIGPAADIYALGAILYELLTGRPPFRAQSPLETLAQVIGSEPVSPRQLNASVPRDLETICLKCIQKRPADRYASAQELADDLARFRRDEPIRARRPSLAERSWRLARKHRRSLAVAAAAAAVTVAAVLGGWRAWRWYDDAQYGSVALLTDEESAFTARIEDAQGRSVTASFTVPTENPVPLRKGSYRLQLSGIAQLSKTFELDVAAGRRLAYRVGLNDRRLWRPLEHDGDFQIIKADGRADIVPVPRYCYGPLTDGLQRIDGATGKTKWTRRLMTSDVPGKAGIADDGPLHVRWISRDCRDLNGDGHDDLLLATGNFAGLLALSGADGATLRWYHAPPLDDAPEGARYRPGFTTGEPQWAMIDGDDTPDVVVAVTLPPCVYRSLEDKSVTRPGEGLVQAFSGRSGELLWSAPAPGLPSPIGAVQTSNGVPFDTTRTALRLGRRGQQDVVLVHYLSWKESRESGLGLRTFDLHTGEPLGEAVDLRAEVMDLSQHPLPRYFDPAGDGQLAVVRVHRKNLSSSPVDSLRAIDAATGRQLWQTPLRPPAVLHMGMGPRYRFDWPAPMAFDSEGGAEDLLFPVTEERGSDESHWLGVARYDGRSGKRVWSQPQALASEGGFRHEPQINRILAGPDVDGDGQRDVFVACGVENRARWEENKSWDSTGRPRYEYVSAAALSGADGRVLWQRQFDDAFSITEDGGVGPMFWWQPDPQRGPLCVIPYGIQQTHHTMVYQGDATAWLLDPRDGTVRHTLRGVDGVAAADLNGDGLADLYGVRRGFFDAPDPRTAAPDNRLLAFAALPPERGRRLGAWKAAGDVDSDGYAELNLEGTLVSGKSGQRLWQIPSPAGYNEQGQPFEQEAAVPAPVGDLNGDGTADVLFWYSSDVHPDSKRTMTAVSGADGSTLWQSEALDVQYVGGNGSLWYGLLCGCRLIASEDLDGDAAPELLFVETSSNTEIQLVVLAGRDGTLRWRQALLTDHDWDTSLLVQPLVVELEGQPGRAIVTAGVPFGPAGKPEVAALRGSDGRVLWHQSLRDVGDHDQSWPALAARRLADGRTVAAACYVGVVDGAVEETESVTLLDATTGRKLWTYSEPLQFPWPERPYTASPVWADVAGEPCLCLGMTHVGRGPNNSFTNEYSHRVLAIGVDGQPRGHFQLEQHEWRHLWEAAMRAADVTGDGGTELIVAEGNRVLLFARSLDAPAWTWSNPAADPDSECELLDLVPADGDRPATLLVRSAQTVYGLDAATGLPRWRCEGPGRVLDVIAPGTAGRPARIAFADDDSVVLHDALPTTAAGRYAP